MHARTVLCGCLAALALATSAHADDQVTRHWIARTGVHPINPKPNNHGDFTVDSAAGVSLGSPMWTLGGWTSTPP